MVALLAQRERRLSPIGDFGRGAKVRRALAPPLAFHSLGQGQAEGRRHEVVGGRHCPGHPVGWDGSPREGVQGEGEGEGEGEGAQLEALAAEPVALKQSVFAAVAAEVFSAVVVSFCLLRAPQWRPRIT